MGFFCGRLAIRMLRIWRRGDGTLMVAPAVEGIDLFKIAGRSISGWMKSLK
jgi:hypothetical protein